MYVFGANSSSCPILLRMLTCSLSCRHKAALPRAGTTHLKFFGSAPPYLSRAQQSKDANPTSTFHCGTTAKKSFHGTIRKRKKTSTPAPATLPKSTEDV